MARKGIAQIKKKASKYRTPSISSDASQESSRASYKGNVDAEEEDGALPLPKNTRKTKRNGSDNNAEERENIDPSDANIARGILKLSSSTHQPRPDLPARRPIRSSDLFSDDLPENVSPVPAITRTVASPEAVVAPVQSPSPRTTAPPAPVIEAPPSKRKPKSKKKAGDKTAANAAPRKDSALTQGLTNLQDPAVPQDDAYLHHSYTAAGGTRPLHDITMSGPATIHGGASIPANQQRNMRACMVCSIVRTQQQFLTQGCPNCESFLELAGSSDQINDCTSQVFEGLISVADTNRSWVAKYQRIEGYVSGVYATQVEGILPEDVLVAVENAGIAYVPRDGSEQEMLGKE